MTAMEPLQVFLGRIKPKDEARFDHDFGRPIASVSTSCNCTAPKFSQGLPVLSVTLVAPDFSSEFRSAYSQVEMENGFDMTRQMQVSFQDGTKQVIELLFTVFI